MSSWNNTSDTSSNALNSRTLNSSDPENGTSDEYYQKGLSGFSQFLAVLLLIIGLLGVASGAMYLALNALRAVGIDPLTSPSPPALVPPASANEANRPTKVDAADDQTTSGSLDDTTTVASPETNLKTNPASNPETNPATKPGAIRPQFKIPQPTSTELAVSALYSIVGLLVSLGLLVSSIQTLRLRRSGSIWLSNFCILSMLLVLGWVLHAYFFRETYTIPLEAMSSAQNNLPPDVPPERVAEFQERMEYISRIGLAVGLGCAGFFMLLHFLFYLISAIHFRSKRVLERMHG